MVAVNKCHLNDTCLFVHGLVCLTSRLYDIQVCKMAEKNFSELEADAKKKQKNSAAWEPDKWN